LVINRLTTVSVATDWETNLEFEIFGLLPISHMYTHTRRSYLKKMTAVIAANAMQGICRPVNAFEFYPVPYFPDSAQLKAIADIAHQFINEFNAPGLSLSIACRGHFVYKEGFGYADTSTREPLMPSHLFRIASVTKPVTSAAIFTLMEQGKLGLNDFVFGKNGLLKYDFGANFPEHAKDITIYHLLTHTCGGWGNDDNDPMFSNPGMNHHQLIEWTLRTQPLQYAPGDHFSYSNFGYCLLGRVIEKISGQSYEEFVREHIIEKCDLAAMRLAGNTRLERAKDEVTYYGQHGENPYGMNIRRMDSHGGWIATPTDLVRFAMHVDGFSTTPNILHAETIKKMTAPGFINAHYACGWAVNGTPNWWHTGSLPGTTSTMVRTASGFCWAALTNTRSKGIDLAMDDMMWKIVRSVPAWRA
jgi:CubicO group peptidase (beta-lactamase class C family)